MTIHVTMPEKSVDIMIPHPYPVHLPQAVLFDWDNTLVDTRHISFMALNATLEAFQYRILEWSDFLKLPPLAIRDYFPKIFAAHQVQSAEIIFHQAVQTYNLEAVSPTPYAENLLQWLWSEKIPMGVVSNKSGSILRQEVAYLGWTKFFQQVVGSYDTPEDKPSPVPLIYALRGFDVPTEPGHHVWFVGDSVVDMMCASAADCVPISVSAQADLYEFPFVKAENCEGVQNLLLSLQKKQRVNIMG